MESGRVSGGGGGDVSDPISPLNVKLCRFEKKRIIDNKIILQINKITAGRNHTNGAVQSKILTSQLRSTLRLRYMIVIVVRLGIPILSSLLLLSIRIIVSFCACIS